MPIKTEHYRRKTYKKQSIFYKKIKENFWAKNIFLKIYVLGNVIMHMPIKFDQDGMKNELKNS